MDVDFLRRDRRRLEFELVRGEDEVSELQIRDDTGALVDEDVLDSLNSNKVTVEQATTIAVTKVEEARPVVMLPPPVDADVDAANIQAVIDAAVDGSRFLPPRGRPSYILDAPIIARRGIYDFGGALFSQADAANLDYMLTDVGHHAPRGATAIPSEVIVTGGKFNGRKSAQSSGKGQGIVLTGYRSEIQDVKTQDTLGHGAVITNQRSDGVVLTGTPVEVKLKNLTFDNPGGYGLWVPSTVNGVTDGILDDVTVNTSGLAGIKIDTGTGWKIDKPHVYATRLDGILFLLGYAARISGAYAEGFGSGSDAIAYSAGTTYDMYDIVEYNNTIYWSLEHNNTGNTPDPSSTKWRRHTSQGAAVAGIGCWFTGYPDSLMIDHCNVSVRHSITAVRSSWNYRCFLVAGATDGNCHVMMDHNFASTDQPTPTSNVMAYRLIQQGTGQMQFWGDQNARRTGGVFGASNLVDAGVVINPATDTWPTSPYVPLSTVTTKGDLLAGTASGALSRLAAGANGTSPVADDTQSTGWTMAELVRKNAADRAWVTSVPPARPGSGDWLVAANVGTTSAAIATLGEVRFVPIDVAVATTIVGLGTSLSVLAVGGTSPAIRMGIYAGDGLGKPTGSPIAGTEVSVDPVGGSIGEKYQAFGAPVTLQPGRYFAAVMLVSGSALTTNPTATVLSLVTSMSFSTLSNAGHRCWAQSAATDAAALPAIGTLFRVGPAAIIGLKVQ